ncbi:MAG: hypothetical protein D6695_03550 [Planctomycetota bacterium]|nr:MAG: hypothetical protein D6695_03550 [Planctomycetota bacterium]
MLSFGFTDLAGSFDTGSAVFRAVASDTEELGTSGDVTRLAPTQATANYDVGFLSRSANANVVLEMVVSILDPMTATGTGAFSITDDDGDVLSGQITGTFNTPGAGITFFAGLLSEVSITGDSFDGPDGGSFVADLPGRQPYDGASVSLFILSGGGFFNRDFENVSVQFDGQLLPSPGSIVLLGAGSLIALHRRR